MPRHLCIHGHFYQPPRFDPWLEEVLPEASAAPFPDWNQRITRESYDPLGFARILEHGRIESIINCYEYINFNFGPTILRWMATHSPGTYQRILEGDRKSMEHFGRGNAMAQIYHHIIMPLSTDEDREVEIQWSIQDFEYRFGRSPEGFWLSETAVSTPDLEALARAGIKFTVLSPGQAREISGPEGENWTGVTEDTLPKDRPYKVRLPSGLEIGVFFYDGPLSQAVAFENLLADGEEFWQRIVSAQDQNLLSLATDGESYGHHFKFGEMALAYVLKRALSQDSPFKLTNFAAYLANHPPEHLVKIHEKSSWSCVHGVKRWQDDCGCSAGEHPEWNQLWRRPLRRSLNVIRYYVDEHFRKCSRDLFKNPRQALLDYGRCLCGSVDRKGFLAGHQRSGLTETEQARALKYLEMQRMSLASFASCAWFFDDLGRIEPLNALGYGLRAMDMLRDLEGPDVEHLVLEVLEEARSNDKRLGDGARIWRERIVPGRMDSVKMAVLGASLQQDRKSYVFPGLEFDIRRKESNIEVNYRWPCLFEEGSDVFTLAGEEGFAGYGVKNRDGHILGLEELGKKLRDYIFRSLDQEHEPQVFACLMHASEPLDMSAEEKFESGQKEPVAGKGLLSAGLLVRYLCSVRKELPDWGAYWQHVLEKNPFLAGLIKFRVEQELDRLTSPETGAWDRAGMIVQRCRRMKVYPDLYRVQNRIWLAGQGRFPENILEKFDFKAG